MTSLAGCGGEVSASVLRSPGYRMEGRLKPTEPPLAPLDAKMPSARSVQDSSADTPLSEEGAAPTPALERATTAQGEPSVEGSPEATEAGIAERPVRRAARGDGAATSLDGPLA